MVAREGEIFTGDFSKAGAMGAYARPEMSEEQVPVTSYLDKVDLNLEHNIIPLLGQNPETEFVFYMVPFSILYWDNEIRNGTFDATMYSLEHAIERLLEYDNVRIYFYHDEWDIATNLDNYKDFSHYGKWINSWITQALATDEGRLTQENYHFVLDEMREYVYSYDYDEIFYCN